jgi:hypothetical protein
MATPLLNARNQLHKLGYMAVFSPFSNSRSVETCSTTGFRKRFRTQDILRQDMLIAGPTQISFLIYYVRY